MRESVVIKKSPIVIVRNFIALQFASAGAYLLVGSLAYYAQIWRAHIGKTVPFSIAQAAFIFMAELVLILYIFLSWYRQTVRIEPDRVIYDQGILFRHHTVVSLAHLASATFTQSILGKMTHYGTVRLHDAKGAVLLRLNGFPEPRQFIDRLMPQRTESLLGDADPQQLLKDDEHEHLERKSTLRWDLAAGKVNKTLERSALKTIAAFLNTSGGHLVLGVGDDRTVVGLAYDYDTLAKKNADGLSNHFGNVFNTMIGAHLRHLVKVKAFSIDAKECMLISVAPSPRPAYLNDDGKEEFFIRTGNGTTSLKVSEVAAYIDSHWHNHNSS